MARTPRLKRQSAPSISHAEAALQVLRTVRKFARFYAKHHRSLTAADKRIVRRYAMHMPQSDDLTLVVHKGHLLVEEMITAVVRSFVAHPDFIDDRLGFNQKLSLARAMSWDRHEN